MRRSLLVFGIGLLGLVLHYGVFERPPATAKCDLSVVLIGFTNNPVSMPPPTRFTVSGSGVGLHALFGVTNTSTNNYVRFQTIAVEWYEGGAWKEFDPLLEGWPSHQWRGIKGWLWWPGFGSVYAVAWPGISTNSSWRLRLSVATDPTRFQQMVNSMIGLEIFRPHDAMILTGPEVSFAGTYQLLSMEHLRETTSPKSRK